MRDIAAQLMDHFRMNEVFCMSGSEELFGAAAGRAHYTSVLRYPVLSRKIDKKGGGAIWSNFPGNNDPMKIPFMARMIEENLVAELEQFPNAWLVPFGPLPAAVLERLEARGIINQSRVLPGMNHPSGTQRNRHNCQLNASDDHANCAPNVGCEKNRAVSTALRRRIDDILAARCSAA
jgi:hypothetical protein